MFVSDVPLVTLGQSDPLVLRVREVLNMNGGDVLDLELSAVLRGLQRARGLDQTGWLDEVTLAVMDISAY